MDPTDPLERQAEMQSVPQPDTPSLERDKSSRGTPSREFNRDRRERTSEADAKVESGRDRKKYGRLVDERSQFRKPSGVIDSTTGRPISDASTRQDNRLNPSGPQGIRVNKNPDLSEKVTVRTAKGILIRTSVENAQRLISRDRTDADQGRGAGGFSKSDLEALVMNIIASRMPEIASMSWNLNGQNSPAIGSIPAVTANGVAWGGSGGSGAGSFGCTIKSATVVTVKKGTCYYAANAGSDKVETDVTCATDGYIYMQLEYSTGAWTGPLFSATDPDADQDDDTSIWTLCEVTVVGSVISSLFQRWSGDIFESRA